MMNDDVHNTNNNLRIYKIARTDGAARMDKHTHTLTVQLKTIQQIIRMLVM